MNARLIALILAGAALVGALAWGAMRWLGGRESEAERLVAEAGPNLSAKTSKTECLLAKRFSNGTLMDARMAPGAAGGELTLSNDGWKLTPGNRYPGVVLRYGEQYAGSNRTVALDRTSYRMGIERNAFYGILLAPELAVLSYGRTIASDSMKDDLKIRLRFVQCMGRAPALKAPDKGKPAPAAPAGTAEGPSEKTMGASDGPPVRARDSAVNDGARAKERAL